MPKEKFINGKRCRCYYRDYFWIWVADTGDFVSHYVKGGLNKGSCRILMDHFGPFVIDSKTGTVIYLEEAVITCFCAPCPNDGNRYMLNHKDGNWSNCHYRNLEWAPYHYRSTNAPKVRLYAYGRFLEVFSSGTVLDGGQMLHVCDGWFDADLNLYYPSSPYVSIDGRKKTYMDDLMRACGYVQGDDANLRSPVILHRNLDYMDFASNNLEWVESSDQRYIDYQSKRAQDIQALDQSVNGNKPRPPMWLSN